MTPEEIARQQIDMILGRCGWTVQDKSQMNLHAAKGVALRKLSFKSGEPDYTLFVGGHLKIKAGLTQDSVQLMGAGHGPSRNRIASSSLRSWS